MATSIELRSRLRKFLADPRADKEFRRWFASLLVDAHQENDVEVEALVHAIHVAFSDAAEGVYTPEQLRALLDDYASPEPVEARTIEEVETTSPQSQHVSIYSVLLEATGASQQVPFWFSGNEVPPLLYGVGTSTDDVVQATKKVA
jgi:hypothetical protein